ncbi:MAG: phospholipid carrier-dependent glycosyltransferase [Anaerolineae bacterium]|nr:phospholipid carrier-dependent glycosyltransferase [Anaerolineae bacterium]
MNQTRTLLTRPWLTLLLIVLIAVALRLAFITLRYTADLRHFETGDYGSYWLGGVHFRDNHDFTNSLYLLRPPLFGLVIYALQFEDLAVLVFNALAGSLLVPLTYTLARQLEQSAGVALGAALVVAIDPASITYAAFLGAEPLANVLVLAMLVMLLHAVLAARGWRAPAWGATAGLALSLSVITRPAPYLIWTGLAVWLLVMFRDRWRVILVYGLVCLLGIGGWVVHNGIEYDNYTVSSVSMYSLLYYRASSVEHWGSGDDMETVYIRLARGVEERLGHDPAAVDSEMRHTHYAGSSDLTGAMFDTALDTFTRYPHIYIATIPVGLARLFGWSNILPRWTTLFEVPWNIAFVLLAGIGLWLAYRRRAWRLFWIVGMVCGYYTTATIIAQTSGLDTRMRTPFTAALAVAAVYTLDVWRQRRAAKTDQP